MKFFVHIKKRAVTYGVIVPPKIQRRERDVSMKLAKLRIKVMRLFNRAKVDESWDVYTKDLWTEYNEKMR